MPETNERKNDTPLFCFELFYFPISFHINGDLWHSIELGFLLWIVCCFVGSFRVIRYSTCSYSLQRLSIFMDRQLLRATVFHMVTNVMTSHLDDTPYIMIGSRYSLAGWLASCTWCVYIPNMLDCCLHNVLAIVVRHSTRRSCTNTIRRIDSYRLK